MLNCAELLSQVTQEIDTLRLRLRQLESIQNALAGYTRHSTERPRLSERGRRVISLAAQKRHAITRKDAQAAAELTEQLLQAKAAIAFEAAAGR